jgi:cold-inducible RNA-binding protein
MQVSRKIFVGNLPWRVTGDDLVAILHDLGHYQRSAKVILDRETGRSRGFGFVEFDTAQAAQDAIRDLDGHVVDGRPLRANESEDKPGGGGSRERRGGERARRGRSAGCAWGEDCD